MRKLCVAILIVSMAMALNAGSAEASIFATELVDHSADLDGSYLYNDPDSLLGKPTTTIGGHVSIVEAAWGPDRIVTINSSSWAIVKFDHQVEDDPDNPYGLDFIVYGNSFFGGSGWVYDDTNHLEYTLTTGKAGREPVLISVSQDGENWYDYSTGPYGDTAYPTNPWVWDPDLYAATGNGWTDIENDYTKPVDPGLTSADFAGLSTYEAMQLYDGSAGGTAFDLAESGFEWIQYIKFSNCGSAGEIDAVSDIAPVPVPAAVWLLGSGLMGLISLRRKVQY